MPALKSSTKRTYVCLPLLSVLLLSGLCLAQPTATNDPGQPATERVLHSFAPPPHGALPDAGVIRDSRGNLYGTTVQGGAANKGVVYKLDPSGHETVLHTFTGGTDGGFPKAGVIRDAAGNLYGTTYQGGAKGFGAVYKLDKSGKETVLHSFKGGADGANPYAGVIRDSRGNLYGTTSQGGTSNAGVVYKMHKSGKETVLHTFTGKADGGFPRARVIRDAAGNVYGTTISGGTSSNGVVYMLDKSGKETVLYNFTGGADGGDPQAGVIRDAAGNLYGTTSQGGASGVGVVYKLDPAGHESVLYSFCPQTQFCSDGAYPYAGVIRDSAGNLYGTTQVGGDDACPGFVGCGVVYKLDAAGHETVLHAFTYADGFIPNAGVIRDSAGNLYGTTNSGGNIHNCSDRGCGVVYKLDAAGHETVLYTFTDGAGNLEHDSATLRAIARVAAEVSTGVCRAVEITGRISNQSRHWECAIGSGKTVQHSHFAGLAHLEHGSAAMATGALGVASSLGDAIERSIGSPKQASKRLSSIRWARESVHDRLLAVWAQLEEHPAPVTHIA
jgi:uncharacterized repeat protein (TIGR03803 family)